MSDKLLEALKAVVSEIKSMHPIELTEALKEASKSEFAQTIDVLNHFTSSVRLVRSDDGDRLSLFIPIESKPIPEHSVETLSIKPPCLFNEALNLPIENITPLSQSDIEDIPNTGLVSKTPYRDITTYREEWHLNPKDK